MDFSDCHVRDAVNFSIPTIMLRRLAAGKIDLASTVKCTDLREQIVNAYKHSAFVLYGDECLDDRKTTASVLDTMTVLAKRLLQDGCKVHCLNGEFLFFFCPFTPSFGRCSMTTLCTPFVPDKLIHVYPRISVHCYIVNTLIVFKHCFSISYFTTLQ